MNRQPSSHPLQNLLRKLQLHYHMGAEDQQAVLDLPYKSRLLEAQSYLVREGDVPDRCAVIVSGYAFRHKLTGEGARQILAIHIPGEAVDFQNMFLNEADHNVQMLSRGEVAEIPRHALEELALSRSEVGRAILLTTLVEASIFREWTLNIGRRDARTRIAHLLCEFAYRLSAQGMAPIQDYELPMTQEQLADATGLTAVHVNRVLKSLAADGLIERDRRVIRFPDWKRMRDVGDFNTRYMHTLPAADTNLHLG
ncbi:MAG TPA: Crp/Fnr family transcriptional regulator [Sphingomicrobium sp.]|nr:Crp/Fnr family transcriptional regulator [Sphingomicrobium sp.]